MVASGYLVTAYGPDFGDPGWAPGRGWHPPVWAGVVGVILWLLFWAAVITAGIVLWRRYARSRPKVGDSALAVLAERYARGEIEEDEYRQRAGVLREQQR